ncbi:MAG: DM13 domain-containing protein [Pseudomonadota bacterium]
MLTRRFALALVAAAAVLPASLARAATALSSGTFTGASNHVTTGTATIAQEGEAHYVVLGDDFTFDGAPDPKVALGKDGYDASTLMGPLKSNTGRSQYEIPSSIDVSAYNEVWIWCERFNVPLGVAKLA